MGYLLAMSHRLPLVLLNIDTTLGEMTIYQRRRNKFHKKTREKGLEIPTPRPCRGWELEEEWIEKSAWGS